MEVFTWYSSRGSAVTVLDQSGRSLRIPYWMISPEAETTQLYPQAIISHRALTLLCELLDTQQKVILLAGGITRQQESDDETAKTIPRRCNQRVQYGRISRRKNKR